MNKKRWIISTIALLISLLSTCIPHMHTIESVDVSHMSDYPVLHDVYQKLSEEHTPCKITTEDMIQIVTVRNLWGSWDRYVLPCYLLDVPDVPGDQMVDCCVSVCVLSPWSEQNMLTDLCRLKMLDFAQRIEPGENTYLYEDAEFTWPQLAPARYRVHAQSFSSDRAFICDSLPTAYTEFSLATNNRQLESCQRVTTTVYLDYKLKMLGSTILVRNVHLPCEHMVNG